jgi:hypothetical protein
MKKTLLTIAALVAATSAYATDLPNKKKAPLPTPVAAAEAPATADSLSVAYGQDLGNNFGSKVDDAYQITYKHNLGGGLSVGGMAQTTQVPGSQLNQNLEAQVGYALPAFAGVAVSGKVGVGEKLTTANFPYYALYGNADYKLTDNITWNAVQYRYRSAVDTAAYGYQSHQLGTGVTYDINSKYSVNAKIARNYDTTTSMNATGDVFMVGLAVKF